MCLKFPSLLIFQEIFRFGSGIWVHSDAQDACVTGDLCVQIFSGSDLVLSLSRMSAVCYFQLRLICVVLEEFLLFISCMYPGEALIAGSDLLL